MGYILSAMFLIVAILCYLEDYIRKYQKPLFFLIGLVLIFVAGFREIGLDAARKITNIHSSIISRTEQMRW